MDCKLTFVQIINIFLRLKIFLLGNRRRANVRNLANLCKIHF